MPRSLSRSHFVDDGPTRGAGSALEHIKRLDQLAVLIESQAHPFVPIVAPRWISHVRDERDGAVAQLRRGLPHDLRRKPAEPRVRGHFRAEARAVAVVQLLSAESLE